MISTPYEGFHWCQDNVSGISFFYLSSEDINNHVNQFQLDERYELTKTVPGIRSYHSFIPDGLSKLILRRKCKDSFSTKPLQKFRLMTSKFRNYYACVYDNEWYICTSTDISFDKQDVHFKFTNKKPTQYLFSAKKKRFLLGSYKPCLSLSICIVCFF